MNIYFIYLVLIQLCVSARHISDSLSGTWMTKKIILVPLNATKLH